MTEAPSPDPVVDPALEERVARKAAEAIDKADAEGVGVIKLTRYGQAWAAIQSLTPEDLLSLLQARSDEVVVTLTREEARHLGEAVSWEDQQDCESCGSGVSKLSTALNRAPNQPVGEPE